VARQGFEERVEELRVQAQGEVLQALLARAFALCGTRRCSRLASPRALPGVLLRVLFVPL